MRFQNPIPCLPCFEIRPSKECHEIEIGIDEKVEGLFWLVYCGEKMCPVHFNTKSQAMCYCWGVQWGLQISYEKDEL
jgi:hypothetical protein